MKHYLLTGMLAVAMFSDCSNDYEGRDWTGVRMSLSGVIGSGAGTRVAVDGEGNAWEAGDAIGVSTSGNGIDYTNHKYSTANGDGNFATEAGDIYLLSAGEVGLTAYYPYKEDEKLSGGVFNFSISDDEGNYVAQDFLFASSKVTRGESTTTQNVNLTFNQMMNRLKLSLSGHEDIQVTYTAQNIITDGTFNTTTGAIENSTAKGDVTFAGTGTAAYLIFPPQDSQNVNLNIKIGEKYYTATIPTLASETGTGGVTLNYTLTIKEEQVTVTLNGITVNGWNTQEGGNIEAGEKESTTNGTDNGGTWGGGTNIDMSEK